MTQFYVTPFLQSMFQTETIKFLAHTYSKQTRAETSGTVDEWGQPVYTYPPQVDGLPCFYIVRARAVHQPYGVISTNVPTLIVPPSDSLQNGDYVSNVFTRADPSSGTPAVLLLAGPVLVETSADMGPNVGGVIFHQFSLIEIEVVPTENPSV